MESFNFQKNFELSLSSEEFIKLYRRIKEKYESLKSFNTPQELIDFLHDFKQKHYQANDNILKILIKEYQLQGKNHFIFNYLLKILTPGLKSIFYRFQKRIKEDTAFDDFDLWSQIRLSLLEVLNEYDVKAKFTKIAVRIMGRIRSHLVFWLSKLKRGQQSVAMYKEILTQEEPPSLSKEIEDRENLTEVGERLNDLVARGIISKEDSFLILGTRVYGESLKELTKEMNLSYEGLKKRRQRAEKKIRKFLSPKPTFLYPYISG